ncbi:hypothetical protein HPP92_023212 [Vanilla planifolia]|uniref:Pectinesterase catalytic domain-containing protein n=1 Tax=Vanilla planifolia TaxID=51239 RepID=A0A835PUQ5_VANPL|nr:hypothetical protein HPP92_023521 [Vanilla planifolia]KAG0460084.1 hypothetical protein HPP92_023212 [Vanilla planifolia]
MITKSMKNLMIVGDGIGSTVVTGSKNVVDGSTTFRSATFARVGVTASWLRDITFEKPEGARSTRWWLARPTTLSSTAAALMAIRTFFFTSTRFIVSLTAPRHLRHCLTSSL